MSPGLGCRARSSPRVSRARRREVLDELVPLSAQGSDLKSPLGVVVDVGRVEQVAHREQAEHLVPQLRAAPVELGGRHRSSPRRPAE